MEYPEYLANGWTIGRGVIEGACKNVIGGRMKGPHRWSEKAAHEMAVLRSLFTATKGRGTHSGNDTSEQAYPK